MCLWLFHLWMAWVVVKEGRLRDGGKVTGYYETQRRVCAVCGKSQLRTVETP